QILGLPAAAQAAEGQVPGGYRQPGPQGTLRVQIGPEPPQGQKGVRYHLLQILPGGIGGHGPGGDGSEVVGIETDHLLQGEPVPLLEGQNQGCFVQGSSSSLSLGWENNRRGCLLF